MDKTYVAISLYHVDLNIMYTNICITNILKVFKLCFYDHTSYISYMINFSVYLTNI